LVWPGVIYLVNQINSSKASRSSRRWKVKWPFLWDGHFVFWPRVSGLLGRAGPAALAEFLSENVFLNILAPRLLCLPVVRKSLQLRQKASIKKWPFNERPLFIKSKL
jgi:hypothetical protein